MSVNYLAETAVRQIEQYVKTNIPTALSELRTDRGDSKVSTEPPQSYFIYEEAKAYKTPAIFIICRSIDMQKEVLNANHITAAMDIGVSVVVEDKDKEKLTVKAWRYQAALNSLLNQRNIAVPDKIKLFIKVMVADFSPVFTIKQMQGRAGVFRKEVALTLEVQAREGF